MMVLFVNAQMVGQVLDMFRQDSDLHFGRTRVRFVDFVLLNQLVFALLRQCHPRSPPSLESPLAQKPPVSSHFRAKVRRRAFTPGNAIQYTTFGAIK
jgi:hypothetical protein